MDRKLIVRVRRLREAGWALPRHRHAFGQPGEGVFSLLEVMVPELNRHARVATLLDAHTGTPVAGIGSLYDAVMLRATADEWVVTGFERIERDMRVFDVAQTWLISLVRMEDAQPDRLAGAPQHE